MDKTSLRALERIHREHEAAVRAYLRLHIGDTNDKECDIQDGTVEVFMNAYRTWEMYESNPPMPVLEWLLTIAKIVCQDYLRNRRKPPWSLLEMN